MVAEDSNGPSSRPPLPPPVKGLNLGRQRRRWVGWPGGWAFEAEADQLLARRCKAYLGRVERG